MGVTRLKRKDRKNKARANNRVARIKQLLATPVIKNVDMDELRTQFGEAPKNKKEDNTEAPAAQTEENSTEEETPAE
ncbi:hypothetical protein [Pontibacter pamirensis]|uniref:hypothetical protein n=1 Tax=Pontibacter pamirensis TaxID=2562824 RepID=UPI0013894D0D|nr:hypothetical protein [Pontibacter pamirensis]